jgi:hypothetical protein
MRLGQLARKLALRPVEIIDFLAQHQIQIPNESNAKLEDQHVGLVLQEFSPGIAEEVMSNLAEKDEPETPAEPGTMPEPVSVQPEQKAELIKAPKVELSGLKVLGKIDLPEPRKKEPAPPPEGQEENKAAEVPRPRQDIRKAQPRRDRTYPPAKNPIAQQREREAREAENRRQEELERQKQKRTEYYQKKVKVGPPTKRVRMVEEPVEELSQAELAERPKTLWGKFMRWLNT